MRKQQRTKITFYLWIAAETVQVANATVVVERKM
jgi:hypothetical protein